MSSRFNKDDVLYLLPVDLNSNLFAYETNFAYFYEQLGVLGIAKRWKDSAQNRKETMNELMWDEKDGLYYDYNYKSQSTKKIKSLASYFPLFHRLANSIQAERIKSNLFLFEQEFGLATCDQDYGVKDAQWNYPVGWAPLHWIVYQGLKNYDYEEDAKRLALKWLNLNFSIWEKTNKFFEKYDIVKGTHEIIIDKRYKENQDGFGWTNAVFHVLVSDLISNSEPRDDAQIRRIEYENLYREISDNSDKMYRILNICIPAVGVFLGYPFFTLLFTDKLYMNSNVILSLPFLLLDFGHPGSC